MDIRKLALVLTIPLFLNGCVAGAVLAGVGAGAVGSSFASDHRGVKQQFADRSISNNAHDNLAYDQELFKHSRISTSTYNGTLLLIGQVQTEDLKKRAGKIAASIEGVKRVYNELQVSGKEGMLADMDDAWVTSKVKTMMLRRTGLRSGDIKVLTENGVVYLMGDVSHTQAGLAADTARRVGGVRKVVEVFQQHS
jgi:osmotically-inducible protein OsmY